MSFTRLPLILRLIFCTLAIVCSTSYAKSYAVEPDIIIVGENVKDGKPIALSSKDGVDWTPLILPEANELLSVARSDNELVILTDKGTLRSHDEVTWESYPLTRINNLSNIFWSNQSFFILSSKLLTEINSGADGKKFNFRYKSSGHLSQIIWGKDKYIAVGANEDEPYESNPLMSPDGINFTPIEQTLPSLQGVVWGDNQFVAVGQKEYDLSAIETSRDGIHWHEQWEGSGTLSSVAWGDNKFVAVGYDRMAVSSDGVNWKSIPNQSNVALVIWTHNKFVAIGYEGTILTSRDGENWTNQFTNYDLILRGIA